MKKLLIPLLALCVAIPGYSQTCEERESKLLGMMGSLTAGFLYNTYGVIGSLGDGYGHDAYNATTVTDLMNAQKKLADNMIGLLEKTITDGAFKEKADKDYLSSTVSIIKGLRTQVELFLLIVKNKSQKNVDAYNEQRNKNWKDLSELMGIKE